MAIDVWSGSELPNLNSIQQQLAWLPIIEAKLDQILILNGNNSNPEEPQEPSQAQQQFFLLQPHNGVCNFLVRNELLKTKGMMGIAIHPKS